MGAAEICASDPDPNMAPIWNGCHGALSNGISPAKMFGHFGIVILHPIKVP
jgi:hypothetical protein